MVTAPDSGETFRFGDFVLSPRRRVLARSGRELPLIPRYFDLLVLLVERRQDAVIAVATPVFAQAQAYA